MFLLSFSTNSFCRIIFDENIRSSNCTDSFLINKFYKTKLIRKNIVKGKNIIKSSMLSSKTINEIKYEFFTNDSIINVPYNSTLDFSNGGKISGRINYNNSYLVNAEKLLLKGISLPSNDIVLSNYLDFSYKYFGQGAKSNKTFLHLQLTEDLNLSDSLYIELSDRGSKMIIEGENHTIRTNHFIRFSANELIFRNINFEFNSKAIFSLYEDAISSCNVTFENCTLKYTEYSDYTFNFGTGDYGDEVKNSKLNISFVNSILENLEMYLSNAGTIVFDRVRCIQGFNNVNNRENIHISSPNLKLCTINNSFFTANGYTSDMIDLFNAKNVIIRNNYFEGNFNEPSEICFVNVKSHGNQVGGLYQDLERSYNIQVISNIFNLKSGLGVAIRVGNFVRDQSVPILSEKKRFGTEIINNIFIFDSVTSGYSSIFSLGSLYNSTISDNIMYVNSCKPGDQYDFISLIDASKNGNNLSENCIIDNNMLLVNKGLTLGSSYFIRSDTYVDNFIFANNLIPIDFKFSNNENIFSNCKFNNNSFDPKTTGSSKERPIGVSNGFMYYDTTLLIPIWFYEGVWRNILGKPISE